MGRDRTPEEISEHMRSIRSKDTKPELRVRRLAHKLGYRFRLHSRHLPGSPDLIFPARKKVIFVHGCFWHQHPGCRYATVPRARPDYWLPKFERTVLRDNECIAALASAGWRSLVIWECETRDEHRLVATLREFLD